MSELTSQPRVEQRSLYGEEQAISGYGELDNTTLYEKAMYYTDLSQGDLMPRARETVDRILGHLVFEVSWRTTRNMAVAKNLPERPQARAEALSGVEPTL